MFRLSKENHLPDIEWSKINHFSDTFTQTKPIEEKPLMDGECRIYKNVVIEKDKYDADNLYYIHFKQKVKPTDFNQNIDGVEKI